MEKVDPSLLPLQRAYHWERTLPHAIWLTQPMGGGQTRDYTWKQALDESRRMAAYLKAQNWAPGSKIAILSKNCAWWLMSDLAIWMAGYVSVPLYPTLTAQSVRQILEHSEAKACFVGKLDEWETMKPGVPDDMPCISYPLSPPNDYPTWDEIVARTAPIAGDPLRAPDELATIVYTSGTTGMPKGVMHNFDNIGWAADALYHRIDGVSDPASPSDRMLSYLPLSHVAERWVVESGTLRAGFRVYFAESLETFADDLRRARPTIFISVPRLWVKFQQGVQAKIPQKKLERLLRIPILNRVIRRKILQGLGLDQCRFAAGGAAPMPPSMLQWFDSIGLQVLEGYGMSENFGCSHSNLPNDAKAGCVGTTYHGVEHRIAENGEVQMRSPAIMQGYYKEPEKTREALTDDGFLRTGDKGEIDAQGRLRITGRVKDLFKTSKGKYVAPAPIEDKLVAFPGIEACCVAGADFAQPFGIVMLSQDAADRARQAPVREELKASLGTHLKSINATLDPHEQMDFLAVVSEQWTVGNGFITPTLKVKRNVIEEQYGPRFEQWSRSRQPVVWVE
jgi:long-chain acyl-CoA synthetase